MVKIDGMAKDVLENSEWTAIATSGSEGAHVVGTWNEYITALGIQEDQLLIPVGHMRKTEENLKSDDRVELLCGTRKVNGEHGPGKGLSIKGTGRMESEGKNFQAVQARFPWARAGLVVTVEKIEGQL